MNSYPIMCTLEEAQAGLYCALANCSLTDLADALHKAQLALNKYERYKRRWRDDEYLQLLAINVRSQMDYVPAYIIFAHKFSSIRDFILETHKKPEDQHMFASDTYEHNDVTIAMAKGLKAWRTDVLRNTKRTPFCSKYSYFVPEIIRMIKELKIK